MAGLEAPIHLEAAAGREREERNGQRRIHPRESPRRDEQPDGQEHRSDGCQGNVRVEDGTIGSRRAGKRHHDTDDHASREECDRASNQHGARRRRAFGDQISSPRDRDPNLQREMGDDVRKVEERRFGKRREVRAVDE